MKHYDAVLAIIEAINDILMDRYAEKINIELEIGLSHGYSIEEQVRIISDYYKYIRIITCSNGLIN